MVHIQCYNVIVYTVSYSGYLPNCALAVEAMLATASLGAIWCSTSPDFGVSVSNIEYAISYDGTL